MRRPCAAIVAGAWSNLAAAAPTTLGAGHAFEVAGALLLVLGLVLGCAWAARRLQVLPAARSGHIRLIESLALGTREKLLLIEVDGTRLLLGVSPGRIERLARISHTPPTADAATRAAPGRTRSSRLDLPSSMPASLFTACDPARQGFHAHAPNGCEKCGLGQLPATAAFTTALHAATLATDAA